MSVTSHRRQDAPLLNLGALLMYILIGLFIGVTGSLVLLLTSLWFKAFFGTTW